MMALDLCNRFGDSGMTAEELLANVEIKSTKPMTMFLALLSLLREVGE